MSRDRDAGSTSAPLAVWSGGSQRSEQLDPVAVGVSNEHPARAGHRSELRNGLDDLVLGVAERLGHCTQVLHSDREVADARLGTAAPRYGRRGWRRIVCHEFHHATADGVAPLRAAGELDFALEFELEEVFVEDDHLVEVGGHETDFDAGRQQVESHGHDTTY